MKTWAIGVLTAALFGATLGAPVCFAADTDVEIDGGTWDSSVRRASPAAVASTEISSFRLRFQYSGDYGEEDGLRGRYPSGWYDLRLEKSGDGANCHLEYWTEGKPGRRADFPVSAVALARLDRLLKEHDVARIDGHSLYNSALGDDMSMEVRYESGETIRADGQGGDVKPDSRYYREEWFIDFFRRLGREFGHDTLGPALKYCSYECGGGKPGGFLMMSISTRKDGTVLAVMETRSRYDAPTVRREREALPETLEELAALIDRGDLFHWAKTPWEQIDVRDGDTVDVSFDYADGSDARISDTRSMPREGFEAIKKVKAFLWELLEDAPQVDKGDA